MRTYLQVDALKHISGGCQCQCVGKDSPIGNPTALKTEHDCLKMCCHESTNKGYIYCQSMHYCPAHDDDDEKKKAT